jgi:hypothetical protein
MIATRSGVDAGVDVDLVEGLALDAGLDVDLAVDWVLSDLV